MYVAVHQFRRVSLGLRIADVRKAKGWSQKRLAEEIGKAQTTLSAWERGRKEEPTRAEVDRIARALGVSVAELEGSDARLTSVEVPLISWVSASQLADIGQITEADIIARLTVTGLPPGDYGALEVVGDSMDRISPEGSKIIFRRDCGPPVSGNFYVFSLGTETTYKRFYDEPVMRLEPFSTNATHRPIFLRDKGWTVVGQVVRSFIDLD